MQNENVTHIDPLKNIRLFDMIRELVEYRELLIAFIKRNIKIKYKQTFMGFLWAIFMPMVILLSGLLVKSGLAFLSGREIQLTEIATVFVKTLPWSFFIGALKFSVGSLTGNANLVGKIYFPRVIFPFSYIFSQFFDFLIATAVFTFILCYIKIGVSIYLLWLPFLLLILVLITTGLGMIFSCANLFFRDVKYIVDVILTFAIFFTPVFYDVAMFPNMATVLLLNPMGSLLESFNAVVILHQAPHLGWVIYSLCWAIFLFWAGCLTYLKLEPHFADNI